MKVHWSRLLFALCLIPLLCGCAFAPFYPVTLLPTECPLPVPDELEEGRTITCGYLQVPQDRAAPAGRQVRVPYAHIRAENPQHVQPRNGKICQRIAHCGVLPINHRH